MRHTEEHGQVFYYNIRLCTVKCFRYVNRARELAVVNFIRPVYIADLPCTYSPRAKEHSPTRSRARARSLARTGLGSVYANNTYTRQNEWSMLLLFGSFVYSFITSWPFCCCSFFFFGQTFAASYIRLRALVSAMSASKNYSTIFSSQYNSICSVCVQRLWHGMNQTNQSECTYSLLLFSIFLSLSLAMSLKASVPSKKKTK